MFTRRKLLGKQLAGAKAFAANPDPAAAGSALCAHTALLSTMITQREQFHDFRIGERVTAYSPYVQQFLSNQTTHNLQHSGDPAGALQQAYRMLQQSVQLNSFVMAYSECF